MKNSKSVTNALWADSLLRNRILKPQPRGWSSPEPHWSRDPIRITHEIAFDALARFARYEQFGIIKAAGV
jgi:hypothetical protein